jgi:hypothetical protein
MTIGRSWSGSWNELPGYRRQLFLRWWLISGYRVAASGRDRSEHRCSFGALSGLRDLTMAVPQRVDDIRSNGDRPSFSMSVIMQLGFGLPDGLA